MAGENLAVIGAQWGDEGKGKIVDLLCDDFDVVARFQGGHNAGHTVKFADKHYALRLIPSGIVHPGKLCLLGNGMVIDPMALLEEIDNLRKLGVQIDDNLKISDAAHVILPYHRALDLAREEAAGMAKIGTTGRGIGPAYETKVSRYGIRVADLLDPAVLREKIEFACAEKNPILQTVYGKDTFDPAAIFEDYVRHGKTMAHRITNGTVWINEKIRSGKRVMFEGAQGTMLDVDHGTYPFVTSSNTVAANAATGSGLGPKAIGYVLGIAKAYTTRVGGGPFPAELNDAIGERMGDRGHEFGTNTGRRRRCGWFDAVLVRQAVKTSGIDGIALTKLDILDGFAEIKVCVGYHLDGQRIGRLPASQAAQARVAPIYETIEGWKDTTAGARSWAALPAQAIKYVRRIEELIEAPVTLLSTSPERADTILVHNPFRD